MPRLPLDLMTAGDQNNLPTGKMVTEKAIAADFGGQTGTAISALGEAGGKLAAVVTANAKKMTEFEYERQFSELQERTNLNYAEKVRGLIGNAEGHWRSTREETQAEFNSWLEKLPPQARAEYAARTQQFQSRVSSQAFQDQYRQQDANVRLTLGEEQRKAGVAVQQQPQSYDDFAAQQERLIDASPLTPLEKTQRKLEVRNALAFTAEQEKARRDPASYVAGGVAASGAYRDKVRAKESGGRDDAQAASSSARGRYQFIESTWNDIAQRVGLPVVNDANRGTKSDPRNNGDAQERALDELIKDNTNALARNGLPVTDANLYMLHFAGKGDGSKLLNALKANPEAAAVQYVTSAAAEANKTIFYVEGKPRSVQAVVGLLTKGLSGEVVNRPPDSPSASSLTPQQASAVTETARVELARQQQQASLAKETELTAKRNQLFIDLKEGSNPEAAYQEARKTGLLSSFEDIQKSENIMRTRDKNDTDLRTGLGLMEKGRIVANPYNKEHKDGIGAVYEQGIKAGGDPAMLAAAAFDRTGILPPQFSSMLRGAIASGENPQRVGAGLRTVVNAMADARGSTALAGVEGGEDLKAQAIEFARLTSGLGSTPGLGWDEKKAVDYILKQRRELTTMDPVKSELKNQFEKQHLTREKLDSRMASIMSSWNPLSELPFSATVPKGQQGEALAGMYKKLAEIGFEMHRNADGALGYADAVFSSTVGTHNGVITFHPPNKAGLPALPGAKNPYAWVDEQAVQHVSEQLKLSVKPSQILLLPIERDGVSTSAAVKGGKPISTRRADGTSFSSVPYVVQVVPETPDGEYTQLPGVFFPDVDKYVQDKNKQMAEKQVTSFTGYDEFGIPYEVPTHAADYLATPEQADRRKKAELKQRVEAAANAERSRQADVNDRYNNMGSLGPLFVKSGK